MLSYGLVNWLTKGLFLGERHTYMSAQVDDLFIDDSEWVPATPCGTPVDNTGVTYRITSSDLQTVLNWQTNKQATSVGANLTLTMAFNGYGTTPGAYTPDTLTPFASDNEDQFNWVSHTYDHTNLDPWMFHQPNLRAYDGQHTLLGDLLDLVMKKYAQYYNLVVTSPTMDALGQTVANRMQYNSAGVTATIVPGVSITITAQKAARVPVTGLNTVGAESYGGQFISYINVAAGQSVTLLLK